MLADTPPAQAFAWRSPRATAMALDAANPPADEALLRMMLDVPHLLRRPIIRGAAETLFGFDRKRLEALVVAASYGASGTCQRQC